MRLIDADALHVHRGIDVGRNYGGLRAVVFKRAIDNAPTIDAVPVKHGEWIGIMTEEWCTFDECKCSVCGVVEYFTKGWKKFSYCPNCGSKMDGGKDDATTT